MGIQNYFLCKKCVKYESTQDLDSNLCHAYKNGAVYMTDQITMCTAYIVVDSNNTNNNVIIKPVGPTGHAV
jgi:hypothetical protein